MKKEEKIRKKEFQSQYEGRKQTNREKNHIFDKEDTQTNIYLGTMPWGGSHVRADRGERSRDVY